MVYVLYGMSAYTLVLASLTFWLGWQMGEYNTLNRR